MSFASSSELLRRIKAKACVFRLLITKVTIRNRVQRDNGQRNTDDNFFGSENELAPNQESGRCCIAFNAGSFIYLEKNFRTWDIGATDNSWVNNKQDGSIPDDKLFDPLYENERDGLDMNEEDGCFDLI